MVHDFTLVYELGSGMGSQEDVLRRLADSDCADATVGWGRPGGTIWCNSWRRMVRRKGSYAFAGN